MRMSETTPRKTILFLVLLLVAPLALAQSQERGAHRSGPGTGIADPLVPWRFLNKGGPLIGAPLVLYWLPASSEESENSPLLTSKALIRAADLCVSFEIVLPEDKATIEKFGEAGKLPVALLVDAQAKVLHRVEGTRGRLIPASVEKMVTDELNARGETMYARITEAKRRATSGDKPGAIDLYKKLWDERCLFPLAGKEAQHALKDLGVTVIEPPPALMVDPNLTAVSPAPAKPKPKPPDGH
jgi:hypothetical protein